MMDLVKHYRVSDDEAAFLDKYAVMQVWLLLKTAEVRSPGQYHWYSSQTLWSNIALHQKDIYQHDRISCVDINTANTYIWLGNGGFPTE